VVEGTRQNDFVTLGEEELLLYQVILKIKKKVTQKRG